MSTKLPQIPSIEGTKGRTKEMFKAIKETIEVREGRLGDKKAAFVDYQTLINLGLIDEADVPE